MTINILSLILKSDMYSILSIVILCSTWIESTKYIRHSIFCLILLSNIPFYVQDESTKYFGHSIFCRFLLMSSIPFYVEHENNCPLWFYVQHKFKLLNLWSDLIKTINLNVQNIGSNKESGPTNWFDPGKEFS